MTETNELSDLIGVLRGQGLAVGVDDVARIGAVLHHTRAWTRERRLRALKTLLGRSPLDRQRFDHIAPLLFPAPAPAYEVVAAAPDATDAAAAPSTRRPRWPLLAVSFVLIAVSALSLNALRRAAKRKVSIDVTLDHARMPPDAGDVSSGQQPVDPGFQQIASGSGEPPPAADFPAIVADRGQPPPDLGFRQIPTSVPSSLPRTLRVLAEGCWIASLLLTAWSVVALRAQRRRDVAIDRLARSTGRRMVQVAVDRSNLHPIDRQTIANLAHMLAAPVVVESPATLDPHATVEQTVRNAGRLALCFGHEREQPALILLEDVSRSMERWPAHAAQFARALEAQGQPVERRFIVGDPLHIGEQRLLAERMMRLEEVSSNARVVVVSDAAYFDRELTRTPRHARALAGTILLSPRPGELWRSGARWVNTRALARTLGMVPNSFTLSSDVPPGWHPPWPRTDAHETADAWRSVLAVDAYFAFAATALLDLAMSWSAINIWMLISDGVITPPWREFERIWDLPDLTVSPGGRLSLAPELRDRLLADARGERPELLHRVGRWIDARLEAAIKSAGESSLGAMVGEVYRDRVARAAGIDGSGSRIRRLARSGLVSVVAAHISSDERKLWRIRDPRTALTTRLRGPLLGLTLMGAVSFSAASVVAPARHEVSRNVPIDAGLVDVTDVSLDSADRALDSNQDRDGVIAADTTLAVVAASDAASAVRIRRNTQRRVPVDAAEVAAIGADEVATIDADGVAAIDVVLHAADPSHPLHPDANEEPDKGLVDTDNDGIPDKDDQCPNEPETYNGFEDEDGCPDRGRVVVTETSIEIIDVIYFEYDKAIIQSRSFPILDAVAATMQGNPSIQLIEIQGHTDERGDDAYNLFLSDRRAEAVMKYLVDKGVDKKRLTAQGYGETQPLDRTHNEAAWRKNRRVEFLIIKRTVD